MYLDTGILAVNFPISTTLAAPHEFCYVFVFINLKPCANVPCDFFFDSLETWACVGFLFVVKIYITCLPIHFSGVQFSDIITLVMLYNHNP